MLEAVYSGISRPGIGELLDQLSSASTYEEFACLAKDAEGCAGLMRFMQLDLHDAVALATDGAVARRLVRVIAGNPVGIAKMTRYLGDGGSYAPVTISSRSRRMAPGPIRFSLARRQKSGGANSRGWGRTNATVEAVDAQWMLAQRALPSGGAAVAIDLDSSWSFGSDSRRSY